MDYVGYVIVAIGVLMTAWLFWSLVLYPNGRQAKKGLQPQLKKGTPVQIPEQNTEPMDRRWFADPKTKALVDKARNELPMLYSKMQVVQQQIVGAKVDMSREEGTLFQNNIRGGILGLLVTGAAAQGMAKAREKQDDLMQKASALQKQIEDDEALVSRYDELSLRFARKGHS